MRSDYSQWLADQQYSDNTLNSQLHRMRKLEEAYGSLDEHYTGGTYDQVMQTLQYSTSDERAKRPNPSKLKFEGSIWKNLQSYKSAAARYHKFLCDDDLQESGREADILLPEKVTDEFMLQRFSLERDMQAALRQDIASLDPSLRIIDDGSERAVDTGFIDITCEDDHTLVVVELKAGKADSKAIGQILGYMGNLAEEEQGKSVRGILVAHDFDRRARAAARVVPTLTLKKYTIAFRFTTAD